MRPWLFLPVVALSACAPSEMCTLIGCESAITVSLPEPQSGPFAITLESEAFSGSVECAPPEQEPTGDAWVARNPTGDLGEAPSAAATVRCAPGAVTFVFLGEEPAMPEELTVSLDGDAPLTQTFSDIDYDVSQPNGPDCPPTCRTTTLELDGTT